VIAALAGMSAVLAATAVAQESPKVKLLPLRVSSNKLPGSELTALTDGVIQKIQKYPAYEILPVPTADPMDMMVDAGCTDFDAECLATIGSSVGADKVLYTEVSDKAGRFAVQIRLVDVKTKESKSPEGGAETREKLTEFVALAIEKVLGPEPVKEPVLTRVEVATSPAAAEVYVDRDFVGLTPVALRLKAGAYQVRVIKIGYEEQSFQVNVEEGKPLTKSIALAPTEVPVAPVEPIPPTEREVSGAPFYKTWWFWTVVGAVVVGSAVTAGVCGSGLCKSESGPTGGAVFTPDPYFAPRDVTLYPRK
jgi:hypothetical protein